MHDGVIWMCPSIRNVQYLSFPQPCVLIEVYCDKKLMFTGRLKRTQSSCTPRRATSSRPSQSGSAIFNWQNRAVCPKAMVRREGWSSFWLLLKEIMEWMTGGQSSSKFVLISNRWWRPAILTRFFEYISSMLKVSSFVENWNQELWKKGEAQAR